MRECWEFRLMFLVCCFFFLPILFSRHFEAVLFMLAAEPFCARSQSLYIDWITNIAVRSVWWDCLFILCCSVYLCKVEVLSWLLDTNQKYISKQQQQPLNQKRTNHK